MNLHVGSKVVCNTDFDADYMRSQGFEIVEGGPLRAGSVYVVSSFRTSTDGRLCLTLVGHRVNHSMLKDPSFGTLGYDCSYFEELEQHQLNQKTRKGKQ